MFYNFQHFFHLHRRFCLWATQCERRERERGRSEWDSESRGEVRKKKKMGKSTSCFKIITCGSDSADKDDAEAYGVIWLFFFLLFSFLFFVVIRTRNVFVDEVCPFYYIYVCSSLVLGFLFSFAFLELVTLNAKTRVKLVFHFCFLFLILLIFHS